MYQSPTSCLVLFFLFTLIHPLTCSSSIQELRLCETQFQCGNITAGFPFWGGNRRKHCGHPLLELRCNKNKSTSLFISNQEFYVLHVDQTSYTLTLARTDHLGSFCSSIFTDTTLPPELFKLSPTYKSLTVFYYCFLSMHYVSSYKCPMRGFIFVSENPDQYHNICGDTFTLNVPTSFVAGEKELNMTNLENVLCKGFEVKVKIDDISCQECLSSHGSCGFNETLPLGAKCSPLNPPGPPPPTTDELHRLCSPSFTCGNQSGFLYPFWIAGRKECGHPDFELECGTGFPELSISSVNFRILAANYDSGIIRLARSDKIDDPCLQGSLTTSFNETILPLAPTTDLLTIYYDCSRDFSSFVSTFVKDLDCPDDETDDRGNYYVTRNSALLNDFGRSCSRNVSIPASRTTLSMVESTPSTDNLKKALEDGFELEVNSDCRTCIDSKGACGFSQTSSKFECYYIEEPQTPQVDSSARNKGNISYMF